MSDRSKLGLGLGVGGLVAFVALLLWLRSGEEPVERAAPSEAPERPEARTRASSVPARARTAREPQAPAPESEPPLSQPEARDHTGELLSAGPAREITLPERPEGAEDNTPAPEQSEAVMLDVITRLDGEIEAAQASGDFAEAARLQVRRDRLERKLAERQAGAPAPPG